MSKRIWDIGDPEPEGVISVVEVDESGGIIECDSDNYANTWGRTNNGNGWKGYKDGKEYRDWPDLVRRYGPVMEVAL